MLVKDTVRPEASPFEVMEYGPPELQLDVLTVNESEGWSIKSRENTTSLLDPAVVSQGSVFSSGIIWDETRRDKSLGCDKK